MVGDAYHRLSAELCLVNPSSLSSRDSPVNGIRSPLFLAAISIRIIGVVGPMEDLLAVRLQVVQQ